MSLRLLQHRDGEGRRSVLAADGERVLRVAGAATTRDLAGQAIAAGATLADEAARRGEPVDLDLATELAAGRLLAPIDHPDPAHLKLSGTGLTHLGSAEGRDAMHRAAAASDRPTDSMRMFLDGVAGGKPALGAIGQQPEWFHKGDGAALVGPGEPLASPAFAGDAGEEPEIAGIYLIDPAGVPRRLGFCLANEFSDHVTERHNYLWLAHSKLRAAALGAELFTGELPQDVRGTSRIVRDSATLWERPFLTGEANMSHSIRNLEAHHFKYPGHRRPGDVHVHFFGTATLSFSDGIATQPGDRFEIEAAPFALPLVNPVAAAPIDEVRVEAL